MTMLSGGTSLTHDYGLLVDANTNLSLPGILSYGDLVTHPIHGTGVVDHEDVKPVDPSKGISIYVSNGTTHASGFTHHAIVDVYKNKQVTVLTEELEEFDLNKFLLWRHPTGEWMHGKNGAIGAAIRYAALLAFSIYGITQLKFSLYWLFMVALPLVIIGAILHGVRRNFEGKQF